MIGWVAATATVMTPLIVGEAITSLTWQVLTTVLVAGVLLAIAVLALRRPTVPEPRSESGPPVVEVRNLRKVYGIPGPIGRAWRAPERFARFVMARGGQPFDPADARALILPFAVAGAGVAYLTFALDRAFFQYVTALVSAALLARAVREVRRSRGKTDHFGRVLPGGVEGALAVGLPWAAVLAVSLRNYLLPLFSDQQPDVRAWVPIFWAVVLLVTQLGRRTARRVAAGEIRARPERGLMRRPRTVWRSTSRVLFGLDFEREQVQALIQNNFRVESGMVGVLGPNGAGKTTLLRILAGILDPTRGVATLGGVPLSRIRRHLARYVGYLPQDFGLPQDMTAREYLDYFALLYELRPAEDRRERVERLLKEVGLAERADEKIGGYSGGMRQRVAVARTLLRLPPIIIVDEPTVGLDPRERIRFRNLLSRLAEGRVVLFSTHVVEDVEVACERVIVLAAGRTVFDGPPERLADAARDRVWTITLSDAEAKAIPDAALVVDQVPEASGWSRCRILSASRPHENAESVNPSLEDGYLWLVHEGAAA
jgi:ABC-type multidrug transport system ATPase subunit